MARRSTPLDDLEPPEMVSTVWVSALVDNKSPTVLEALRRRLPREGPEHTDAEVPLGQLPRVLREGH